MIAAVVAAKMPRRAGGFLGLASVVCMLATGAVGQQVAKTLPAFDAASVRPFVMPAGGWAWARPK